MSGKILDDLYYQSIIYVCEFLSIFRFNLKELLNFALHTMTFAKHTSFELNANHSRFYHSNIAIRCSDT